MGAIITPKTYAGNNINDGSNYRARFLASSPIGQSYNASPVMVQTPGGFPKTAATNFDAASIPLLIEMLTPSTANREQLFKWFRPQTTEATLIATDESAVDRRILVRCLRLVPYENWKNAFVAVLLADNPLWEKDTATVDTHANCAGASHAWTATNNGSADAKPTIAFTLNAAKNQANDYRYFKWASILNLTPKALFDLDGEGYPTLLTGSLDTATLAGAGKCLTTGDDLRVFCDGAEIKRFLADMNTADTELWANIADRARALTTLKTAVTISPNVPADGGALTVNSVAGFQQSGYVAVGLAAWEIIYYNGTVDYGTYGQLLNIKRAQRGSTAYASAVGYPVVWVEHDCRILYGHSAAVNPPNDVTYSPMFDLATSHNSKWNYITDYFETGSHRTAQWQRAYRQLNTLSAYLRAYEASSKMYMEDSTPEAGKPKANVWWLNVPIGVVGTNAIHHDIYVPANMLLDVYGNDGVADQLLAQYNSATDGDGLNLTPTAAVFNVQYRAKCRVITAGEPSDVADNASSYDHIGDSSNDVAQGVTFASDVWVYGISVQLKKSADADGNVLAYLLKPSGTPVDPANSMFGELSVAAVADISSTAYGVHTAFLATPRRIPAGTYYLDLRRSASTGTIHAGSGSACYAGGSLWKESAATWTEHPEYDFWFRVLGDGSVCQPEVPTGSGDECTVDDLELILDSFSDLTHYGLLVLLGTEQNCYHLNGVLTVTHPDATVQTLTLNIPAKVGDQISVNCAAKTITNVTTGEVLPLGVVASDGVNWLTYAPGANAVSWAEAGMIDTTIVSTHRDTYAGAGG